MREIEEIWIINYNGITLYNECKGDTIDPTLFGGFITAIQSFITTLGYKQIESITLGNSKLMIYQSLEGIFFVTRSKKSIKDKNIINHLKVIEKRFSDKYKDKISTWNGDRQLFDDFSSEIEEIFNENPEKEFERSLW